MCKNPRVKWERENNPIGKRRRNAEAAAAEERGETVRSVPDGPADQEVVQGDVASFQDATTMARWKQNPNPCCGNQKPTARDLPLENLNMQIEARDLEFI